MTGADVAVFDISEVVVPSALKLKTQIPPTSNGPTSQEPRSVCRPSNCHTRNPSFSILYDALVSERCEDRRIKRG